MNLKTWISAALCVLLAVAGGVIWFWAGDHHRTERPDERVVAEAEPRGQFEKEERDAPEFTSRDPRRYVRTRWTALDDAGTNHRCNQDTQSQVQNETPCASSPVDPEVIVVGANDYRAADVRAGYYRTTDGGNTWQDVLQGIGPTASHCDFAGDPSITADANGNFFAVYCTYYCTSHQGVYSQKSVDNGATWLPPVTVGVPGGADMDADKPNATCDVSPDSPYLNNIYAAWMEIEDGASVHFARSTDGGASFSDPVDISGETVGWCPSVATGPDGEVYCTWLGNSHIGFNRSLDGGVTWGNSVNVAARSGDFMPPNPCNSYRVTHSVTAAADISEGPSRGRVYVCWDAARTGSNSDILFSRSTDQGLTWTGAARVNDDATTNFQWWPWMAVHPRTGDVGISWLDRREDPANCTYAVWGAVSTDGGTSWAPNFRISDVICNPENSGFLGDYSGATTTSLGFMSSWADTRNDDGDVYAAWWNDGDSLVLHSPNGGETLAVQQPCSVRWKFRYAPDSLKIELNRNYPSETWDSITTVKSDSGMWVWTPTDPATSAARLRIVGQHFPTIGDTSDANFTIGMMSPRVTAYRVGNDIRIKWASTGAAFYHIYSDTEFGGAYATLEGTSTGTSFLDLGAANEPGKYYVVTASTEP